MTELEQAYSYCRKLNARHGKTFFLATGLLPADRRKHVHALYGFARYADDLVDIASVADPAFRLAGLEADLQVAFDGGPTQNPVVRAVVATVAEYGIEHRYFADFLASMTADLTVTRYPTFADLERYMWGSAAVIGLQLLPILGVVGPRAEAERAAAALGQAFQLTNFLRDVAEDQRRGRIYLPLETLAAHGVSESMLAASTTSPQLRAAVRAEVERTRGIYQVAVTGIDLLAPESRDCVRTAATLYGEILDQIEANDYGVLERRAIVPRRRRLVVGLAGYRAARAARRPR